MRTALLYFLLLFGFASSDIISQPGLDNDTKLVAHKVFGNIEVGIPAIAARVETNKEPDEQKGVAYFKSSDGKIDITLRKMEQINFDKIKRINEGMAIDFYKGKVMQSEIVRVNDRDILVIDVKGLWEGVGETVGMFRYYFNAGNNSYNLLMRYPAEDIRKTKELKVRMLESIQIR